MATFAKNLLRTSNIVRATAAAGALTAAWSYSHKQQLEARSWSLNGDLKYPASCSFPDLSTHKNTLAKYLTPAVSQNH